MSDDPLPLRGLAAGAFAQHLGVVDLTDLEAAAPGRGPRLADAAVGNEILRGAAEQSEQRQPVLRVGVAAETQRADQPFVQQHGQLADGGIRAHGGLAVDGDRIRVDVERDLAAAGEPSRRRYQALERGVNRRMRARIQRHRPRRRLARARKIGEHARLLRRHGVRGQGGH